jgi:dihydrofolate reductase
MRKLIVFNNVSIDGYFTDPTGDMSWAHKSDPEWLEFTSNNASGGGMLLFGRKTYDMMASYWPTEMAMKAMPAVAQGMNRMPKIVFSRTMAAPSWANTRLIKHDIAGMVRKLKEEPGPGMAIMGSGMIVAQLTDAGLIDEYHIVTQPIALGAGRTLFDGIKERVNLKIIDSRAFKNGNVFTRYSRA